MILDDTYVIMLIGVSLAMTMNIISKFLKKDKQLNTKN